MRACCIFKGQTTVVSMVVGHHLHWVRSCDCDCATRCKPETPVYVKKSLVMLSNLDGETGSHVMGAIGSRQRLGGDADDRVSRLERSLQGCFVQYRLKTLQDAVGGSLGVSQPWTPRSSRMEPHLPIDGRISQVKVLARRHVAAIVGLSVPNLPSSRFESAQSAFCRSDQRLSVGSMARLPPHTHGLLAARCSPQNPNGLRK